MINVDFEDGLTWGKPSRSGENGGNCVCVTTDGCGHVASHEGRVGIRDSKEGLDGRVLWVDAQTFTALRTFVTE